MWVSQTFLMHILTLLSIITRNCVSCNGPGGGGLNYFLFIVAIFFFFFLISTRRSSARTFMIDRTNHSKGTDDTLTFLNNISWTIVRPPTPVSVSFRREINRSGATDGVSVGRSQRREADTIDGRPAYGWRRATRGGTFESRRRLVGAAFGKVAVPAAVVIVANFWRRRRANE